MTACIHLILRMYMVATIIHSNFIKASKFISEIETNDSNYHTDLDVNNRLYGLAPTYINFGDNQYTNKWNKKFLYPSKLKRRNDISGIVTNSYPHYLSNPLNETEYTDLENFAKEEFKRNDYCYARNFSMLVNTHFNNISKLNVAEIFNPKTEMINEITRMRELLIIKFIIYKNEKIKKGLEQEIKFYESQTDQEVEQRSVEDILLLENLKTKRTVVINNLHDSTVKFYKLISEQKSTQLV
ncbi:hypothetical protein COBT_001541 [Conglomerata obtusa]